MANETEQKSCCGATLGPPLLCMERELMVGVMAALIGVLDKMERTPGVPALTGDHEPVPGAVCP